METVDRPCRVCKKIRTLKKLSSLARGSVGPDPCLGMLPGVTSACCGHGEEAGYISFECGFTIRWEPGMRLLHVRDDETGRGPQIYIIKDTYKFLEEQHRGIK